MLDDLEIEYTVKYRPMKEDYKFEDGQKLIIVRSKSEAKAFMTPDVCWAAISIATYPGDWPTLNGTKRMGLLQLSFLDWDKPAVGETFSEGTRLFSEKDADEILNFVNGVWDKIDLLLVHCEAGISRSPAVAAALCRMKYGHDMHFFQHYTPNRLVYRTLLDRAVSRGIYVPTERIEK